MKWQQQSRQPTYMPKSRARAVVGVCVFGGVLLADYDPETLFNRFRERAETGNRHPGHGDDNVLDELHAHLGKEQSLIMEIGGSILAVDTTDFAKIDYQTILHKVKVALKTENGA